MSWLRRTWRRLQAGPKFDLPYILARANPAGTLAERVEFCENLLDWVRYTAGGKTTPLARIRFLLRLLERKPEWRENSAKVIRSLFFETEPYSLFYEMGMPHGATFLREFFQRWVQIVLPISDESNLLYSVVCRVFYDSEDIEWVQAIPDEVWGELLDQWIFPEPVRLPAFERALIDVSLSLSIQGAALSLRTEFMSRSPEFGMDAHPFLHLEANLASLSAQIRRDPSVRNPADASEAIQGVFLEVERARNQIRSVRAHLEETGVSVDLVYQMDRMKLYLERIVTLTETMEAVLVSPENLRKRSIQLFRVMIAGLRYDEDFNFVLRKSLRLLATKMVERAGNSGESYFTSNWAEWKHLFWAAAGGGALTAVTAMMKTFTPHSPLFLEFFYSGMNYSMSFVLMYFLGLKLATKQPSMTAAALAGRLAESGTVRAGSDSEQTAFASEVARITRAQFAAVLGNILFVIPAVIVLDLAWRATHSEPFYGQVKAIAAIDSVSLLHSGTLVYAFWTGIVLWLASLGAGFFENFVVYIRAGELVSGHRVLKRVIGAKRAAALGEGILKHTTGVTSSVLLGFLLAATPSFSAFFGLPLDVRHVTLTTGTLTFAYMGLGSGHGIPSSLLSVAVIGGLNFGVSFVFAILTALRARNADMSRANSLFRFTRRRFWSRPWEFFFPPRERSQS
jgi:site-specific recombinase